jgi:hypothetical protein
MEQKVLIKNFEELIDRLKEITIRLTELKPKKKINWALIVSIIALGSTFYLNRRSEENQNQIQAYTNWQNFLSLALNNPALANGLDSINGKSIAYI